ncbi:zinc finger protein GIS-like [Typha angustifolia]|uniref:zinc finger protein GIS-like n=1 Tax=Typha angustifolia TaxID=59011 RepID=UPI003C30CEC1
MSEQVDSFSQLPFIRPVPPALDKPLNSSSPSSSPPIRLFGFDFPHEPNSPNQEPIKLDSPSPSPSPTTTTTTNTTTTTTTTTATATTTNKNNSNGESVRKFECHYCCRNFPTSQALGGHQNAHKRERQHAKRAHLHSAAMAVHHHHASMGHEGHVYGLFNYHRLGSIPSAGRFEPTPPAHYPSWTSTSTSLSPGLSPGARFYGGIGTVSQPINGSPLPGLWRLPVHGGAASFGALHRDRSMEVPLLGAGVVDSSSPSSLPQERGGYGSAAKDGLSLDLHL